MFISYFCRLPFENVFSWCFLHLFLFPMYLPTASFFCVCFYKFFSFLIFVILPLYVVSYPRAFFLFFNCDHIFARKLTYKQTNRRGVVKSSLGANDEWSSSIDNSRLNGGGRTNLKLQNVMTFVRKIKLNNFFDSKYCELKYDCNVDT